MKHFSGKILPRLFRTKEKLDAEDVKNGLHWLNIHGIAVQSMTAMQGGGPFLAAFALALGASNYEIGLIATIASVGEFMQIPGLFLLTTVRKRRFIAVVTGLSYRLLWGLIILTPVLFPKKGVTFLITCLFASALISGLMTPAWNSLIRDIVPRDILGRFFSNRLMLSSAAAMAFTLAGGKFVDLWKAAYPTGSLYGYSVLFTAGLVAGIISVYAISRLPEQQMVLAGEQSLTQLLMEPVNDGNFRKLLAFIATWTFAVNMASPFFIVYMMRRLGLSLTLVTLLTITSQTVNLLFLRIWGRLVDRFSNKSVLAVSGPLFLFSILGWVFTTMPEKHELTILLLFAIHILSGISMSGVSAGTATIALKLSPDGLAHGYLAVYGLTGAATGAVAPLVGGIFSDFFAARKFSLPITLASPMQQTQYQFLNLQPLDFLFLFAFLIGLVAVYLIGRVREEGEVTERELFTQLVAEVAAPLRVAATIPGIRHLVHIPSSALHWLVTANKNNKLSGHEYKKDEKDSRLTIRFR